MGVRSSESDPELRITSVLDATRLIAADRTIERHTSRLLVPLRWVAVGIAAQVPLIVWAVDATRPLLIPMVVAGVVVGALLWAKPFWVTWRLRQLTGGADSLTASLSFGSEGLTIHDGLALIHIEWQYLTDFFVSDGLLIIFGQGHRQIIVALHELDSETIRTIEAVLTGHGVGTRLPGSATFIDWVMIVFASFTLLFITLITVALTASR